MVLEMLTGAGLLALGVVLGRCRATRSRRGLSRPRRVRTVDSRATDMWEILARQADWLDRSNGTGDHETAMRLLKIVEELGEAASAYLGVVGQNPRKGVTHTPEELADELIDTSASVLVALHSFTDDPKSVFETKLAKIRARTQALEVSE